MTKLDELKSFADFELRFIQVAFKVEFKELEDAVRWRLLLAEWTHERHKGFLRLLDELDAEIAMKEEGTDSGG